MDSLPNVAGQRSASGGGALGAALRRILDEPDRAVSVEVPGSGGFARRQPGKEATLSLVSDPPGLSGVGSDERGSHLQRGRGTAAPSCSISATANGASGRS